MRNTTGGSMALCKCIVLVVFVHVFCSVVVYCVVGFGGSVMGGGGLAMICG